MSEHSQPVVLCTVPSAVAALLAGRLREAGIECETAPAGIANIVGDQAQVLVSSDKLEEARAIAEEYGP
jgi:hypothetical protein